MCVCVGGGYHGTPAMVTCGPSFLIDAVSFHLSAAPPCSSPPCLSSQLRDNVEAFDVQLSDECLADIDVVYRRYRDPAFN